MNVVALRKLQLTQLQILKDVAILCHKYNIVYYLIGGTLLGTIRHKGFIPWDDDIDIAMMREDYEKFLSVSNELGDRYCVQNKHSDKRVSVSFTKIRLNNTYYPERGTINSGIHSGIFIDIFPLDFIDPKKVVRNALSSFAIKFLSLLSLYKGGYRFRRYRILNFVLILFSGMSFERINKISNWYVKSITKKKTHFVTSLFSGYGYKRQILPSYVYGLGRNLFFEDSEFTVPSHYDFYLVHLFGEYANLPPENKRRNHTEIDKVIF